MNSNTEVALESLVAAFDAHPEQDATTILETWRNERDAKRLANEARMKAMSQDARYTIGRVELVEFRTTGDTIQRSPRIVERMSVRYGDLPAFASKYGLDYKRLMDVLEGRQLEISAHGKVWRNGSPNASFVDTRHSAATHRAMVARETAIMDNRKRKQDELNKIPTSFTEPVTREWRPN